MHFFFIIFNQSQFLFFSQGNCLYVYLHCTCCINIVHVLALYVYLHCTFTFTLYLFLHCTCKHCLQFSTYLLCFVYRYTYVSLLKQCSFFICFAFFVNLKDFAALLQIIVNKYLVLCSEKEELFLFLFVAICFTCYILP